MVNLRFALVAVLLLHAACPCRAQAGTAPGPPAGGAVARVGDLTVSRRDYEQRFSSMESDYRGRTGRNLPQELKPFAQRQALEQLVRERLLVLEAGKRSASISDQEAEERMKQDPFFSPNGVLDEPRFAAFKATNPEGYRDGLAQTKRYLAGKRLEQRVARQSAPDRGALRERLGRQLSRVSAQALVLRRAEFSGAYPEPREHEVRDYYDRHPEEFRTADQARVTVLLFNASPPGAPETEDPDPAWRARADSALRALRAGATLESLAAHADGLRTGAVLQSGRTPDFWGENRGWESQVLAAAPGTVLPVPMRGQPGWLVVRVDETSRAGARPLREVAREVRSRLRLEARLESETRALRELYEAHRDSLRASGLRLRYVAADTGARTVAGPSSGEIERYYRSRLADFATYDPKRGEIVTRPLAEVRGELVARWKAERRYDQARRAMEKLFLVWDGKRRDPALEKSLGGVHEVGPVPLGFPVDETEAGAVLRDSLLAHGGQLGTGFIPWSRGFIVYQVHERVPDFVPTFEHAREVLRERHERRRKDDDERGARALFESRPDQFRSGPRLRYRIVTVPAADPGTVTLTREDVESYFQRNKYEYGIPAQVRARHVVVAPGSTPEEDAAARARAGELLRRARAGEDFAGLARAHSDDPATRADGGDLGFFGPGVMVPEFERAAFALQPGELSEVVKTEFGYHVILCVDRTREEIKPLAEIYSTVGWDAARERADSLARLAADSLRRAARRPRDLLAYAARRGDAPLALWRAVGERYAVGPDLRAIEEAVEGIRVGDIAPGTYKAPGAPGWSVVWADSLAPPRSLSWEESRARAVELYQSEAGERALAAKRTELDSLARSGRSWEEIGELWGGLAEVREAARGGADLAGTAARAVTDSLLYGGDQPAGLAVGEWSTWIRTPGQWFRARVLARVPPAADLLEQRVGRDERILVERGLYDYFEGLKRRFPVRILDPALRAVELPRPELERG